MRPNFFSGKWKGEFVYGPEYGDIEGEKATFMLFVEKMDDNGFEGKAFDIDGVGINKEVAAVRGFVDDGMISFVKQYPICQIFLEDGTTQVDVTKPSPEIHYSGEYFDNLKSFKGIWEIEWSQVNEHGGYSDYYCSGTWEMKKEVD